MPTFSLLLPTRERKARAEAFLASVVKTAKNLSEIEVILAIDDDDEESKGIQSPDKSLVVIHTVGSRTTMGALNTRCLQQASGKIIILVNDDMEMETVGWDELILSAVAPYHDGIFLVNVNDGEKDHFPCFPILSKRVCDWIDPYPKEYLGANIDTHIYDIFVRLRDLGMDRIIDLPQVSFRHDKLSFGETNLTSSRTYYQLWKTRERVARALFTGAPVEVVESSGKNAFFALLSTLLFSKQSLKYRVAYFCYHLTRHVCLLFKIDRLKHLLRHALKNKRRAGQQY